MNCQICKDQLWVCENHNDKPWNDGEPGCCGGAGSPCTCNVLHRDNWKPEHKGKPLSELAGQQIEEVKKNGTTH